MQLETTSLWLNIRQAAIHVGMSVAFMRKAVRNHSVPFVRVGSKALRFRLSDLDRWMESSGSFTDSPNTRNGRG